MTTPQTSASSIAMALAGKTASVDIPAAACRGGPSKNANLLPTPPNSISPTLHPYVALDRSKQKQGALATSHPESELDLGESVDSAGAITPAMLAQHHLPEIMLHQGPLAIRHVMGCLTTSVPGFARIPPAKARRLVVAALEGRGCDQQQQQQQQYKQNDVIYEKVGWGRWDARRVGDSPRHNNQFLEPSPPSSLPNSFQQQGGVQIPGRRDNWSPYYGTSMTGDSAVFSYSEEYGKHRDDASMLEDEADKMSLDGEDNNGYLSVSEAAPDNDDDDIPDNEWGEEDVTDEEDWAQIGADALRARSLNAGSASASAFDAKRHQFPSMNTAMARGSGGGPAASNLAKSVPQSVPIKQLGFNLPDDREERAAVEALLRLGSM